MDETQIRRFFDGLHDASGFAFATTAVGDGPPGPDGHDGFDEFVVRCLGTWMGHSVDEQRCLSLASLETDHRRRDFRARPSEPAAAFTHRLRDEVHWLADPWLFVATLGEAAVGHLFDPLRIVGVEQARRAGLLQACGVWYAEARGRGVADRRHGAMVLRDGGAQLVTSIALDTVAPMFTDILRGHPARRRHRLRTGGA